MSETKKVPRERLTDYLDTFTKRFLRDDSPEMVDVEIMEPELGDQLAIYGARLVGITYDRKENALELALESGDHRVYEPKEVWAVEEEDGFVSAIQVVHPDGSRDVVSVKRGGLRRFE